MPLYEYECTKCGRRTEVIQKFSDPLRKTCDVCKGPLKKLLSAPAIQFKGSGWYVNDYGKGGSGGGTGKGKDKEKEKGSESKDSASVESSTKPAKSDKPAKKKDG